VAETASFIDAALKANRDNFILKASAWAEVDPLFSTVQFDGATAVFSGSSTDTFNILALTPSSKRKAFDIIEDARRTLFGDNRFAVWSWQDGQLQDLPVDKSAIEENLIMTCDLDELAAAPTKQKTLVPTKAQEPQQLMDVGTVIASAFGDSEEGFMVQSVFSGQEEASIQALKTCYFLSYEDAAPVATGSYIIKDTLAGIYDIAVLPAKQKDGLASRMFAALIAAAAKEGATSFTLQASTEGASIYERAGFQTLGVCWCLDIS
jgi:GNAT superfamily N-acetyltransferase